MSKHPDYSTWPNKQQAADTIGVSPKQIERLARSGELQQAMWKRPSGGQPIVVYAPDDVGKLARARQPTPFVLAPADAKNGMALTARANGSALLQSILETVQTASQTRSELSQALFLTIPEAAQYTGLTQAYIRRQCQSGGLLAIKDGGWKIHRARLDALGQ
jgi:excisionase family DNA binding protein